jgi:AMP-polyphosphate phosphotransferase
VLETAETGDTIDRESYEQALPDLRVELINAQYELQHADFPVIVLIGADDRIAADDLIDTLNEWMDARYIDTRWFGRRSEEENERPRFWRYWRELPPRGRIGVFAGAWATNPITEQVFGKRDRGGFRRRLEHIRRFEQTLVDDGALLLKFWLHLPEKEHHKRAQAAEKHRHRHWKFDEEDWKIYKVLDKVLPLCEQLVHETSTACCPWQLVETTDARCRDLTVARRLLQAIRQRLDKTPAGTSQAPAEPAEPCCGPLDSVDLSSGLAYDTYQAELLRYQQKIHRRSLKAAQDGRTSILVFEGWDAAGKGGAIRRLTRAMSARNYQVIPIGVPTDEELSHQYLWRFWRNLPRAGKVMIFDRSWYGRVLVERVEGFASEDAWKRAYQEINDFESQLVEYGFNVQKFWLHIDRQEQLRRFKAREKTLYKKYKITDDDYRNRDKWDAYVCAVNEMVERTSCQSAPWHLIPANDKRFARVQIARIFSRSLKNDR